MRYLGDSKRHTDRERERDEAMRDTQVKGYLTVPSPTCNGVRIEVYRWRTPYA